VSTTWAPCKLAGGRAPHAASGALQAQALSRAAQASLMAVGLAGIHSCGSYPAALQVSR